MPISRRSVFKQVFIVAGGVIFLPACFHQKDKSAVALRHLRLDTDQEETLEELADTLIPVSSSPAGPVLGAKAVAAHLFVLKMMDDCYPEDQQQKFMKGLAAFDQKARQQYGKPFGRCDQPQKDALMSALEASSSGPETPSSSVPDDLSFFYRENKKLVIRGWLGSQYFLTKIEIYELVPGRWHGCVPVKKNS